MQHSDTSGEAQEPANTASMSKAREVELHDMLRRASDRLMEYVPELTTDKDGKPKPTTDCHRINSRIRATLAAAFEVIGSGEAEDPHPPPAPGQPGRRASKAQLRTFFQLCAVQELRQLSEDFRRLPAVVRLDPPVGRTAIGLALEWAKVRVDPPSSATGFEKSVRPHLRRSRSALVWSDYYNAACGWAAHLEWETDEKEREAVARQAVRYLERAVQATRAGELRAKSAWLFSGDPDLTELRRTTQFADFAGRVIPQSGVHVAVPSTIREIQLAEYVRRLAHAAAEQRRASWEQRVRAERLAEVGRRDEHAVEEWREIDDKALELARRAARDRQHWQSRLDFLEQLGRWSARSGPPLREVSFPDTAEIVRNFRRYRLGWNPDDVEQVSKEFLHAIYAALDSLTDVQAFEARPPRKLSVLAEERREFWRRVERQFERSTVFEALARTHADGSQ